MQGKIGGLVATAVFAVLIMGFGFAFGEMNEENVPVPPTLIHVTPTSDDNTSIEVNTLPTPPQVSVLPTSDDNTKKMMDATDYNEVPAKTEDNTMETHVKEAHDVKKASHVAEEMNEAASEMQSTTEQNTESTVTVRVHVSRKEVNKVVESVKKTISETSKVETRVGEQVKEQEKNMMSEWNAMASEGKEMAKTVEGQAKEQEKAMEKAEEQVKVSCSGAQCTVEIRVPREQEEQMNRILEEVMGKEAKRAETVAIAIPMPAAKQMEQQLEINGIPVKVKCEHGACIAELPATVSQKEIMSAVAKQIMSHVAPEESNKLKIKKVETYNLVTDNVTKVVAQNVENNSTVVTYAATGYKTVAVTVEIPKSVLPKASGYVEGNIIIVKDDPVLRIYLSPDGNSPSIVSFTVKKAVEDLGSTVIEFAACQIKVVNVRTTTVGDKWQVSFQIRDGNTPVYIKGVHIVGAGVDVVPQYDAATKTYIATVKPAMGLKISAYVSGCGEITAAVPEPQQSAGVPGIVVGAVILAAIAALIFGVWLNMKK